MAGYPPRDNGSVYQQPQYAQSGYSSYEPPRDNSYVPHDMAVTKYDDERSRYGNEGGRRSSRARSRTGRSDQYDDYYDDRDRDYDRDYDDRRRSRDDSRPRSKSTRGERIKERVKNVDAKEAGATLGGAAIGALAGRELGKKSPIATLIGAAVGAWGAHELESRHEKKKERRYGEDEYRSDHGGRRSVSGRSRSRGPSRSEYDEYDDRAGRDDGRRY